MCTIKLSAGEASDMSKKKLLMILGIAAGAVLLAFAVLYGIKVLADNGLISLYRDPTIRELRAYTMDLRDIDRIEVIYRPGKEWIRQPARNPEIEEVVQTITDPEEIRQIMKGFKRANNYYGCWTQCGFYFRLDFYSANELAGTLLVGFDDCKSFTTADIKAVGTMANDTLYNDYIVPMR